MHETEGRMRPSAFNYLPAGPLAEALAAKAAPGEDARFLAGGQSLWELSAK
jgi:CO/xanthine dehydrogenase FAD-binding subunit